MARTKKEPVQTTEEKTLEQGTPSVETLMQELSSLAHENETLKAKLKMAVAELKKCDRQDLYVKLEWLWKVITLDYNADVFGSDFVDERVEEFKTLMTPKEIEEPAEQ